MANITKEDILRLLGEETAKVSDLKAFIKIVTDIVKQSKEGFDSISKENLAKLKESLDYFNNESTKMLADLDDKTSVAYVAYEKKLADTKKEVVKIIEEAKKIQLKPAEPGKPGEPGKDADEDSIVNRIIEKIPNIIKDTVKLPETKDYVVDTGLEIVTKINALPHDSPEDDEYKIDWVHIKGWPKRWGEDFIYPLQINTGGGAGTTFITAGDNVTITGIGTVGDPYVINANAEGTVFIEAGDNITIDGTGTELDPYIINAVGDGTGTVTNIVTSGSIAGGPITTTGTLSLVNDNATPGNNFYYGTNGAGTKGYFSLAPYMTNIYNSDGQITDPVRTLDANGNDLFFTNIRVFDITVGGEVGEGFQVHAGLVDFNVNYNADVNFSTAGGAGSLNMDSLGGTMILSPSGQNLVIGNSNLTGQSGLVISNMPGLTPVTSDFGFLGFNTTTGEVVSVDASAIPTTATLTATQIGFGSGANTLTGDDQFTYDESNKRVLLTPGTIADFSYTGGAVDNITFGAAGSSGLFNIDGSHNLMFGTAISTGSIGVADNSFTFGVAIEGGVIYSDGGSASSALTFGHSQWGGEISTARDSTLTFGVTGDSESGGNIINEGGASLLFGRAENGGTLTNSNDSGFNMGATFGLADGAAITGGISGLTFGQSISNGEINGNTSGLTFGNADNARLNGGIGALVFGNVSSGGELSSQYNGLVFGNAEVDGRITTLGQGAIAAGQANNGSADASNSGIQANANGAIAMGVTSGGDEFDPQSWSMIQANAAGSQAFGQTGDGGQIRSAGTGSYASGSAQGNNADGIVSLINSVGTGSQAFGNVSSGARIEANGDGSLGFGAASDNNSVISAAVQASVAFGHVESAGHIVPMGDASMSFGHASGVDGSDIPATIQSNENGLAFGVAENGGWIGSSALGESGNGGTLMFGTASGEGAVIWASGAGIAGGNVESGGIISNQSIGGMAIGFAGGVGSRLNSSGGDASFTFAYTDSGGQVESAGSGSIAAGRAVDGANIRAFAEGALAMGFAENSGSGIVSNGSGGVAMGNVTGSGSSILAGQASFAFGYSENAGQIDSGTNGLGAVATGASIEAGSLVVAIDHGTTAHGYAAEGGIVRAGDPNNNNGYGAFAIGSARGLVTEDGTDYIPIVHARKEGSFAQGIATNAGVIQAWDNGSFSGGRAEGTSNVTIDTIITVFQSTVTSRGEGSLSYGWTDAGGFITTFDGANGAWAGGSALNVMVTELTDLTLVANVSTISANGPGALAHGYVNNGGTIQGIGTGSTAFGYADGVRPEMDGEDIVGTIQSGIYASSGALAVGCAQSGWVISAGGSNGGFASGSANGGNIQAAGEGSMAVGHASTNNIIASGPGSFAGGESGNGKIEANAVGTFAWGSDLLVSGDYAIGFGSGYTNSTDNTLTIGFGQVDLSVAANAVFVPYLSGATTNMVVKANEVTGKLENVRAGSLDSIQYVVPNSGDIVSSDDSAVLILNPAGTLATLTVQFPNIPVDGQKFTIATSQTITSLSLSAPGILLAGIATLAADNSATWIFEVTSGTWYRINR